MDETESNSSSTTYNGRALALPSDVRERFDRLAEPNEVLVTCLLADILPSGEFGERWAFLTNRRLLAIGQADRNGDSKTELELRLGEIDEAEVRDYVASS